MHGQLTACQALDLLTLVVALALVEDGSYPLPPTARCAFSLLCCGTYLLASPWRLYAAQLACNNDK